MGRKVDRGNINSKLNIKTLDELIDDDDSDLLCSTITAEQKEETKKDDDFIQIIGVWKDEKKSEQNIKVLMCLVTLGLMIYQIIKINKLVVGIGSGTYKIDEWTLRLLIVGVFTEVVAVVKIIVENLFPKNGSKDFLEFLNKFHNHHKIEE